MTTATKEQTLHPVHEGSVHSADGTHIGYVHLGQGPAVVFVHGSISSHADWMPVARLLAHRFTCIAVDRRGRGRSGHGHAPYSMDRECEDLAAVLAAAGPDAAIVAHSYGGICALETARRIPVHRLVVYEPPLPTGGPIAGEHFTPYSAAVERGDLDAAIEIGLTHFSRLDAKTIAAMRILRGWSRLSAMAPGWVRELEVMDAHSPDAARYTHLTCPVMMLVGSESPEHPLRDASRALAQALPHARIETLAGQGHGAMRTAPQLIARLVEDFLRA